MALKFYAGDIFGCPRPKLVLGQACDSNMEIDNRIKSYTPLKDDFIIEWSENPTPNSEKPTEDNQAVRNCLLDRPYLVPGIKVRRNGINGVIKGKSSVVTLKLLKDDKYYLGNVSTDRLRFITDAQSLRHVSHRNGFIGQISEATSKVTMSFLNGSTCSIEYQNPESLYIGGSIKPKLQELNRASWEGSGLVMSGFKTLRNLGNTAQITDLEVKSVVVDWLCQIPPRDLEKDVPSETIEGNDIIADIKYIPLDQKKGLNSIWNLQIGSTDLENLFETEKEWLDKIFGVEVGNPPEKKQRLNLPEVGSIQPVEILLEQSIVQVEYENGQVEEVPSGEIHEVLSQNSTEIQSHEFVVKIDQSPADALTFGLILNYYEGEMEQTPLNPTLNPTNMKSVQWFRMGTNDPEIIGTLDKEDISVFDLQSLRVNHALRKSDFITRTSLHDEFMAGSFKRILENGLIEIVDVDENIIRRWPSQLAISQKEIHPQGYFGKVYNIALEPNVEGFRETIPLNLQGRDRVVVLPAATTDRPEIEPENPEEFVSSIRKHRESLISLHPVFSTTRIQTFLDREDLFMAFTTGDKGSFLEDVLFVVEIQLDEDPLESPVFTLKNISNSTQNILDHWDELNDFSLKQWGPEETVLDGIEKFRGLLHSTEISNIKHEDEWLPISLVYPNFDKLSEEEKNDWRKRWMEVIAIQSIRYVYNSIAYPSGLYGEDILGHYRHKLPEMVNRWRTWVSNASSIFAGWISRSDPNFATASPGFISTVQKLLQRFEPFLTPTRTTAVQPSMPMVTSNPNIPIPNTHNNNTSFLSSVGKALGWKSGESGSGTTTTDDSVSPGSGHFVPAFDSSEVEEDNSNVVEEDSSSEIEEDNSIEVEEENSSEDEPDHQSEEPDTEEGEEEVEVPSGSESN